MAGSDEIVVLKIIDASYKYLIYLIVIAVGAHAIYDPSTNTVE